MIILNNITRVYRDGAREVQALDGIDLHIAPGEFVALTGRSGSGKSTLLHLIGGLEWPSSGSITVSGTALHTLNDSKLTRFRLTRIGFVFQFFHLLPALTVMENLLLPAEMAGLSRREASKKGRHLLEAVGLTPMAQAYPDHLSGGEQQRVAVARGMMLEPPILLADEPTGNLDSESGQRVLELIREMSAERGTTVILATHSQELAALAQRSIVLLDGRIASDSASSGKGKNQPAAGAPLGSTP